MESNRDTGSNWAVTRIGQTALFWGALLLVVSFLDVFGKWDVLSTLRASVTSQFEFLVEPWVAVILVNLALGLIWLGSRSTPPISPEEGQQGTTAARRSVLREATIPLFLALVCGLAVGGFEWKTTDHRETTAAQQTPKSSGRVLSGTLHHRPRMSEANSARTLAVAYDGPDEGDEGANTVARWVPVVNAAMDQATNADVAGEGSPLAGQLPADPRAAVRAFAYDGARRILESGKTTVSRDTPQHRLFEHLQAARQARDWRLLAALAQDAIQKSPQWLTPYAMAGEAYANLGQVERAVPLLEYVEKYGQGNPDYDA